MVGVSNKPVKAPKSLPLEFYLGKIKIFLLLVESAPVHLIVRDLLEVYSHIPLFLRNVSRSKDNQISSSYNVVTHDEDDAEEDRLLALVPKELWALDSTDNEDEYILHPPSKLLQIKISLCPIFASIH